MKQKNLIMLFIGFMLLTSGCKKDPEVSPVIPKNTISNFGKITSAVVIVNPVINKGSVTTISSGSQRSDISIHPGDLPAVKTDVTGMALIEGLPTGDVRLTFSSGNVNLNVVNDKELYDVIVAVDANGVQKIIADIRYPIGSKVIVLNPGQSITQASAVDNAIIFLNEGTYSENVEIKGSGVLIFGAWSPNDGQLSVIDGNLKVMGGNTRIRGIKVSQTITASANSFSAAFCTFNNANITGNTNSLIRNNFTGSQITVPSSNAVLVDNTGIH